MSKKPPLLGSDIPIEVVNAVWDDLPEEFRSSRIYGPYGLARYWLRQESRSSRFQENQGRF